MARFQFRDKELEKISGLTGLDVIQVARLSQMGVLDEKKCIDMLILHDWRRLKMREKYKVSQIIDALAERYHVAPSRVKAVAYRPQKTKRFCTECGKAISGREYMKGNGKCRKCISTSIDF